MIKWNGDAKFNGVSIQYQRQGRIMVDRVTELKVSKSSYVSQKHTFLYLPQIITKA